MNVVDQYLARTVIAYSGMFFTGAKLLWDGVR
jgi:hypothetical protein